MMSVVYVSNYKQIEAENVGTLLRNVGHGRPPFFGEILPRAGETSQSDVPTFDVAISLWDRSFVGFRYPQKQTSPCSVCGSHIFVDY